MEEKQTSDENREEIGTVEIPPVTGVFGQPWSMQKTARLNGCLWTRRDCRIGQYRCRRNDCRCPYRVLGLAMISYGLYF